jgi:hypothetical protein
MFDWAALTFLLSDSIQLLKLIAMVAIPVAAVSIVCAWLIVRRVKRN